MFARFRPTFRTLAFFVSVWSVTCHLAWTKNLTLFDLFKKEYFVIILEDIMTLDLSKIRMKN